MLEIKNKDEIIRTLEELRNLKNEDIVNLKIIENNRTEEYIIHCDNAMIIELMNLTLHELNEVNEKLHILDSDDGLFNIENKEVTKLYGKWYNCDDIVSDEVIDQIMKDCNHQIYFEDDYEDE